MSNEFNVTVPVNLGFKTGLARSEAGLGTAAVVGVAVVVVVVGVVAVVGVVVVVGVVIARSEAGLGTAAVVGVAVVVVVVGVVAVVGVVVVVGVVIVATAAAFACSACSVLSSVFSCASELSDGDNFIADTFSCPSPRTFCFEACPFPLKVAYDRPQQQLATSTST